MLELSQMPFHIVSYLALLQLDHRSTLYLAIMLQSFCLHLSTALSLLILTIACMFCPEHCANLIALWWVGYAIRKQLYLSHDNPFELLCTAMSAFSMAAFLTKDWNFLSILCQACCAFVFTINGGLIWIARHRGLKEMRESSFILLCLSVYIIGLWIFPLDISIKTIGFLFILESYKNIFTSFERNILSILNCTRVIGFSFFSQEQAIFMFMIIIYSSIAAYKGLFYDFQHNLFLLEQPDPRAQRRYRTLSLGKKLSASWLP